MKGEYPAERPRETTPSSDGEAAPMGGGWHHVPADGRASSSARRHVAAWLRGHGADRRAIDDLSLAASELAANVVQHGDATELWVRLHDSDPKCWTLEVVGGRNPLPPQLTDPQHWVISRPDSPHGRGLGIVRTVVDEIEVSNERGGLAIRCHRLRS